MIAAAVSGAVFGLGLVVAGMIDPRKVLDFLDVAGDWDPSLLLVLGAADVVAFVGYRAARRRTAPWFDLRFHLRDGAVDRRLLVGAALFGLGWGIGGYCPGPAIASLAYLNPEALILVPAMLTGAAAQRWLAARSVAAPST